MHHQHKSPASLSVLILCKFWILHANHRLALGAVAQLHLAHHAVDVAVEIIVR